LEESQGISWERERLLEALEAFQRGVADAPLLRKRIETQPLQAEPGQVKPMTFVISTDEVDRHGDVIAAEGWSLESYRRNPVFLWAHDYARPVIGRAVKTWTEPHLLLARMEFAPTQFAQEVAMLYRSGYQRGVSVGFKPLRYEERRHEKTGAFLGIRFLEQELLETSAVPVPANQSALRRALSEAPRVGEYLRRLGPGLGAGVSPAGAVLPALEAILPELVAGIDEMGKLAEELARIVAQAERAGGRQSERSNVAELLAELREARR
jgi:HK97 family phage prohead protease